MKKKDFYSTAMHAAEIVGIIVLIKAIEFLFPNVLPSESIRDGLLVVLGSILKFARSSETVPLDDYVNKAG